MMCCLPTAGNGHCSESMLVSDELDEVCDETRLISSPTKV